MGYEYDLRTPSPFSRPSATLLEAFARESRVRRLRAGQVLWWEGDQCSEILVLESGRLRNTRISVEGQETTLAVVEPVTVLGAMELFGGGTYESSMIALRTSTVRFVSRRVVQAAMRSEPSIADEVLNCLVHDLRRANDRHVRIVNCDVRQRLLLWLAERAVNDIDPYARTAARVTVDRTQGELADELWTTRSTLNRVIHELEQSGAIRIDGDVIVLLKPAAQTVTQPLDRQPASLPTTARHDSPRTATR